MGTATTCWSAELAFQIAARAADRGGREVQRLRPEKAVTDEQKIPSSLASVVGFFSDASSLEKLMPPGLGFRIATPLPVRTEKGTRIAQRLRPAGVPVRWRTRIACREPMHRFVDTREEGSCPLWEHTHVFEKTASGVPMRDIPRYRVARGFLGKMACLVPVKGVLGAVFNYRKR